MNSALVTWQCSESSKNAKGTQSTCLNSRPSRAELLKHPWGLGHRSRLYS